MFFNKKNKSKNFVVTEKIDFASFLRTAFLLFLLDHEALFKFSGKMNGIRSMRNGVINFINTNGGWPIK